MCESALISLQRNLTLQRFGILLESLYRFEDAVALCFLACRFVFCCLLLASFRLLLNLLVSEFGSWCGGLFLLNGSCISLEATIEDT